MLLLAAGVFAGVQFILELVAWANRGAAVSGKTDAEVRATIIGDIAPFLEQATKQIPERARVLLVTNESPWRARYLLLPRTVYVYHGPLPKPEAVEGEFLEEEKAFLEQLGISWVVSYTRTTTGPYRILDSTVVPVTSSPASPAGAAPTLAGKAPGEKEPAPPAEGERAERSFLGRLPVVGTLAALLVAVLAGGVLLGVVDPRRGLFSYESLALAYGLGTGCITLALFLLSWLSFPLRWCPPVIATAALGGFIALAVARLRNRRAKGDTAGRASPTGASRPLGSTPAVEGPKATNRRQTSVGSATLRGPAAPSVLLASLLLVLFLSQGYYTSTIPVNAMDAMGFWGYSAKAIFFDGTVTTPAITDPLREHPHPRYPLLVPLAQVWVHLLRGGYEDKAAKLLFVGFYVALAGVVYGAAKAALSGSARGSRRATQVGLVGALLVATLPPLRADGYGAAFALADLPLACYIASALLCWVRWAGCPTAGGRDDFRALLLASAFAALAAWTKNEGLAFFAILTVLTALRAGVFAVRRTRRADFGELSRAAVALVGGWLLLVPWLLFRRTLPIADENYPAHLQLAVLWANLGRVPVVLFTWLREFADASQWSLLWLLAAVAACWAIREVARPVSPGRVRSWPRSPAGAHAPALWLLAFGFSQLLVYTVVYVVAPWEVTELLKLTSTRLLLHVLPAAVLLSVMLVGALWTQDERRGPPAPEGS